MSMSSIGMFTVSTVRVIWLKPFTEAPTTSKQQNHPRMQHTTDLYLVCGVICHVLRMAPAVCHHDLLTSC
eukprot:m.378067 g.378067  ORF g.378067 m.378067 type:complete len:70 (-) comp90983_c0_seq1:40-249(-)